MADAHVDAHGHGHEVASHAHHDPNIGSTGLDNRKVVMWTFLGSDCMFFGSLIATYLSYKGKSLAGPGPARRFDIPLTSVSASLLLLSSLTMVLALAAPAGEPGEARRLLAGGHRAAGPALRAATSSTSSPPSSCTRA